MCVTFLGMIAIIVGPESNQPKGGGKSREVEEMEERVKATKGRGRGRECGMDKRRGQSEGWEGNARRQGRKGEGRDKSKRKDTTLYM